MKNVTGVTSIWKHKIKRAISYLNIFYYFVNRSTKISFWNKKGLKKYSLSELERKMSSSQIQEVNGEYVQKKKDVIDEAIDRIQEKLKQLKTQKKISQQDAEEERKKRFQERLKTFSSVESSTAQPTKVIRGQAQDKKFKDEKSSEDKKSVGSIWEKE